MAPRPNLTGFDIKKLAAASGHSPNDPWARRYTSLLWELGLEGSNLEANLSLYREQWRYTGPFTRANRFKGTFPGFGTAAVAFTAYCIYEYLFLKDEHHGHTEGDHGAGH